MFADLLGTYLARSFELVGVVENGRELVKAAREHAPHVIVADISMPELTGIEALRALNSAGIGAKVIFLTMHENAELAGEALQQGAAGYVLKHCAGDELVKAIHEVLAGRVFVSPRIAGAAIKAVSDGNHRNLGALTERQRDVLMLVAQGMSLKQIAAELCISQRTVETHKYEMMRVLGAHSTADLVHFAIRHGVVPA
jgi:DNA-binding NarL/FixJ family response regulator